MKWEHRLTIGPVEVAMLIPERGERQVGRWRARDVFKPFTRWSARRVVQPPVARDRIDNETGAILSKIAGIEWYHSIDLGHGVVTPGFVDHRAQVSQYHLPESLVGKRCLDVASFDGFWAFEMERQGATEVIALDIARFSDVDIPKVLLDDAIKRGGDKETGQGFRIAREVLGSKVQRVLCSVYDLTPERLGKFDFVFVSDLLLHLRNPQLALERMFSVCRGSLLAAEVYNPRLDRADGTCLSEFGGMNQSLSWWKPNTNTLKMMMTVAGFEPVEEIGRFVLNARSTDRIPKVVLRGRVPENPGSIALEEASLKLKEISGRHAWSSRASETTAGEATRAQGDKDPRIVEVSQ
jgi:tRNA (mo5U34)-methyltransferase